MQIATLHVREKLDVARFQTGFPTDAERPNILRCDPSAKPILGLAITGKAPILQLKEGVREVIKPRLEQVEGIAFAQISGDIERVIDVEVKKWKLNSNWCTRYKRRNTNCWRDVGYRVSTDVTVEPPLCS